MTWESSSEQLVQLFGELVRSDVRVVEKKMFGWPSAFVNGNLACGLHKEAIIFRLPEADQSEFLSQEGAGDFEPMPGRRMRGYYLLSSALTRDRAVLSRWFGRSVEFTATLPAKEPRPKKPKVRNA